MHAAANQRSYRALVSLRRRDQCTVAALTLAAVVAMAVHWLAAGGFSGRVAEGDGRAPRRAEFHIDVNTASWPELTLLPRIGETLSQRIVQSRTASGPFRNDRELQYRVRGIGPKTVARMSSYLLPLETAESRATR